jgi:PhnB protein
MIKLSPYIHFNGNCREAMEFYRKCLGGNLVLSTFADSPMVAQTPPAMKDKIIHSRLETDGIVIVADDMTRPGVVTVGNNISLYVQGAGLKEIEVYFSKIAEGGKVTQPLTEAFFGVFGIINDKFGISWIFQADRP